MTLTSGHYYFVEKLQIVEKQLIALMVKYIMPLSKLITLLISNIKEFNHLFKSRSCDIVLLKLGNLHQNAKRYEASKTEREARRPLGRAP